MLNHYYQINFLVCRKKILKKILFKIIYLVEYPFVIPQPEANQPSSPSNSVETVTTLTKNMKLNVNKTSEGQGYLLKIILS